MKSKKLISLVCAVSMMLSILPAASAAENPATRTVICQLITVEGPNDEDTTVKYLNVEVPADASAQEEAALVRAAAYREQGLPAAGARANRDILFEETQNYIFASNQYYHLCTVTALQDYKTLSVMFNNLGSTTGATNLFVQFNVTHNGSTKTYTKEIKLNERPMYAIVTASRDSLNAFRGDELSFYAYPNQKSAFASYCMVDAFTYDFAGG